MHMSTIGTNRFSHPGFIPNLVTQSWPRKVTSHLKMTKPPAFFLILFFWKPKWKENGQRFVQRRGAGISSSPPPTRNLEIEYGCYISYLHVTEHKYVSSKCCLEIFVPDCNLRGCKISATILFLLLPPISKS